MPDVYVSGFGENITERDLQDAFEQYDHVDKIRIIPRHNFGLYGFVVLRSKSGAEKAISGLNGTQLEGRTLVVKNAHRNFSAANSGQGGGWFRPTVNKFNEQRQRRFNEPFGDRNLESRTFGYDRRASGNRKRKLEEIEGRTPSVKKVSNRTAPEISFPDNDVQLLLSYSPSLNEPDRSYNSCSRKIDAETSQNALSQSRMGRKRSEGAETFEAVRQSDYFVDKSKLIEEIISNNKKVLIVTAPARIGKSVNLDMINSFLGAVITRDGKILSPKPIEMTAFRGTDIAKNTNLINEYFQRYIVIYLDFTGHVENFEEAVSLMRAVMISAYNKHKYLIKYLEKNDREFFEKFTNAFFKIDEITLERSLLELALMLHNHHNGVEDGQHLKNYKIIIFVDEFDSPVINSMFSVDAMTLRKIVNLRDSILNNVTKRKKGDELLFMSIFTGVADICCPTTSWLNHAFHYPFLSRKNVFAPYYGVSKEELKKILEKNPEKKVTMKDMCYLYNGYKWRSDKPIELLNMWSVINAVRSETCSEYFAKTSALIMRFEPYLRCQKFEEMVTTLIEGNDYECGTIDFTQIISVEELSELALNSTKETMELKNVELMCVLLFQVGWVTHGQSNRSIRVPNEEIRVELQKSFYSKYFIKKFGLDDVKVRKCGTDFGDVFTNGFRIENFCKSYHSLCFSPSRLTKYKLNHSFMQSLILMISGHTGLKLKAVGVEFPVKEGVSTRCDNIFYTEPYLAIVQLKFNESVEKAMSQIKTSNYMNTKETQFILEEGDVFKRFILFAINVDEKKRETEVFLQVVESDKKTVVEGACDKFKCNVDGEPANVTSV